MQQMNGNATTTLAKSLDSGTGPGAKATTGAAYGGECGNPATEPCATITMHVTHGQVIFTAMLDMGGMHVAQRVFERRKGNKTGWVMTKGSDTFMAEAEWISSELAVIGDRIPFPFALANMLPGRKASAAAVAQAAQEVANG